MSDSSNFPADTKKHGKHYLLAVPDYQPGSTKVNSYIRLGTAHDTAGDSGHPEVGEDLAVAASNHTQDTHDACGMRDHTDGHRVITTRGRHHEVVAGGHRVFVAGVARPGASGGGDSSSSGGASTKSVKSAPVARSLTKTEGEPSSGGESGGGEASGGGESGGESGGGEAGGESGGEAGGEGGDGGFEAWKESIENDPPWTNPTEEESLHYYSVWKSDVSATADFSHAPQLPEQSSSRKTGDMYEYKYSIAYKDVCIGKTSVEYKNFSSDTSEETIVGGNVTETTTISGNATETKHVKKSVTEKTTIDLSATETSTIGTTKSETTTIGGAASEITTIGGAKSEITTVGGANSEITTIGGVNSEITTVAGVNSSIELTGGLHSEIAITGAVSVAVEIAAVQLELKAALAMIELCIAAFKASIDITAMSLEVTLGPEKLEFHNGKQVFGVERAELNEVTTEIATQISKLAASNDGIQLDKTYLAGMFKVV